LDEKFDDGIPQLETLLFTNISKGKMRSYNISIAIVKKMDVVVKKSLAVFRASY